MTKPISPDGKIGQLERLLLKATADSKKASEARAALGPNSSRARITSANARWARCAEYREKLQQQLLATDPGEQ